MYTYHIILLYYVVSNSNIYILFFIYHTKIYPLPVGENNVFQRKNINSHEILGGLIVYVPT